MKKYNYTPKGTLVKNIDGQVYDMVDLYSGNINPVSTEELRNYAHSPSTCLVKDLDGKLYSIVDLYNGIKKEILTKQLKNYNYQPMSCLINNIDGTTTNLIDIILMYREQGGTSAIPKTYKEVIEARMGINDKKYNTLSERLNSEIGVLNKKGQIVLTILEEEKTKSEELKRENEILLEKTKCINESNLELKETNEVQDILIDTTMVATDEIYSIIEPLLDLNMQSLNVKRGGSKMVDLYVAMIQRGLKTIDEIPKRYREEVQNILNELEK